jgi:hypothetical protein
MMEVSGAGSALMTNGSGCGSARGPKTTYVRIRIHNTAFYLHFSLSYFRLGLALNGTGRVPVLIVASFNGYGTSL